MIKTFSTFSRYIAKLRPTLPIAHWRNLGHVTMSLQQSRRKQMKYALIGAAAFAAAALATPALAQAVIDDPGYCAQYYPNANCQNLGPGNPYTNGISPDDWHNGNDWHNRQAAMVHHHHRHHHGHPR
jgi:hypothetical protein